MFSVKVDLKDLDELLKEIDPRKIALAMHSALNKVSQQARTHAANLIGAEFNVQKSRINEALKITTRSSGSNFTATITGTGMGLPLSLFGARQTGVNVSKKTGFKYNRRSTRSGQLRRGGSVSVEVKRGRRKTLSVTPAPFITILQSKHIGVFQRTGRSRFPIQQLYGPGIGGAFGVERINNSVVNLINEKFEPLFLKDLNWRLSK